MSYAIVAGWSVDEPLLYVPCSSLDIDLVLNLKLERVYYISREQRNHVVMVCILRGWLNNNSDVLCHRYAIVAGWSVDETGRELKMYRILDYCFSK
jgi:hypothetical protein